jgi:hypothetical protein
VWWGKNVNADTSAGTKFENHGRDGGCLGEQRNNNSPVLLCLHSKSL